jgi:ankyrin repeat protein
MVGMKGVGMDEAQRELLTWFESARSGDEKKLEEMLDEGFWSEAVSPLDGMTALMVACSESRQECVRLLASNSDVNARDAWGNTAILVAAACGNEDAVSLLIAKGADQSLVNFSGLDLDKARQRAAARGKLIK